VSWNDLLASDSIDASISIFNDFVVYLFNLCFPPKAVRLRSSDPPWMTPFLKFLFNRMDYSFFHRRSQYLLAREEYLHQVSNAKAKFSRFIFSGAYNPRLKWKAINKISKRPCSKSCISDQLADDLNRDFSSSFVPPDTQQFQVPSFQPTPPSSFSVSEFDVFKELKSIRSSGGGPDLIHGWLLKRYAYEFAYPLSLLFNRCLQNCHFPEVWKLANINPIPKGRSRSYRPISLLSSSSKILERIFAKLFLIPSIYPYFNRFQFGFLPTGVGGCSNAVTYFRLHTLQHLSSSSGHVRCVQIDLAKAFDRASHSTILSSLQAYIPNNPWLLSFVHSFLTNRWQRVAASSGHFSSWTSVTSGVPQGSVLGPILFAIMLNKFPQMSKNSRMIAYADDLLILHDLSPTGHDDNLQADLDAVLLWLSSLKFSVNIDKFKCISFSRNSCSFPPLLVDRNPIPEVDEIKFLGVTFQSNIKLDSHLTSMTKKASSSLYFVKLLWLNNSPSDIIWEAYLSLVFSCFSYCWPALCDIPSAFFQKLCAIEKRACRWAGIPYSDGALRSRLDGICLRLIRKIAANHSQHPLADFFVIRSPRKGLRHARSLQIPSKTKAFFRKSFIKFSSFS
jgi:hypothetical protein